MNTTTLGPRRATWRVLWTLHLLALSSLLVLAVIGRLPEDSAGWVSCPPAVYADQIASGHSRRAGSFGIAASWPTLWRYARLTLPRLACQLGLLALLARPLQAEPLLAVPVLRWLLDLAVVLWPTRGLCPTAWTLRLGLCRLHQGLLLSLVGSLIGSLVASHLAPIVGNEPSFGLSLGLTVGVVASQSQPQGLSSQLLPSQPLPSPKGRIVEGGIHEVHLSGDFLIRYQPVDEFDRRLFLLFLRNIHLVDGSSKRPYLRQEWLAEWFGTYQELISRWESYHRAADWRRLMSRQPGPPFSLDEQRPILQLWALNFWWTPAEVVRELAAREIKVTLTGVETVAKESGFWWARQVLLERFGVGPDRLQVLQPKDGWLVGQLFKLVAELLAKLESGQGLSVEERLDLAALQTQGRESGQGSQSPTDKPLPPLYAFEHWLFGWWQELDDGSVRCPYCQSTRVGRKSRTGRPKRFYDARGQLWVIEVNRYYCKNKACRHGSFTDLPAGLLPYSRWSETWHYLALHQYAWARGTCRLVARQLGVSGATAYRWVEEFGQELLPVGALFGLVRSSGVVGIDEKWVKVPKNDKPESQHRRWMYVHFAVDVYTYDLLHIAIYPNENAESTRAFLLELRAKGYHPSVIVTDLRRDYGPIIAAVFPKAEHHECIFHALQTWFDQLRDAYGSKYRQKAPEAKALAEALQEIFQARTKRTARERYDKVLEWREEYVAKTPKVAPIFDSLERHFPRLLSAIESERIPLTNNAVELVIRRFEQHYRGFGGFDSIETAESYLAVFELVYRFSPFSSDARPAIRNKCPLELAGYDVGKLPIAQTWQASPLPQPSRRPAGKEAVPSA